MIRRTRCRFCAGVYNATEPSDPGSHVRDALSLPTREPQMSQPSTGGVNRQAMPGYAPAPRRPSAYGGSTMRGMMPMSPTDASARRMMYFPSAPTDFGAGGAMPMPPTMAGGSYGGGGPRPGFGGPSAFGRSSGGFGNKGQSAPMMRSYTSMETPRYASNVPAQIGSFGSNAGAPAGKAFSDFRAKPAVSPYMNIFNTGTAGGTISPYNSLVRPQLDQNQQNQQLNTGLGDLQNQLAPLTAPRNYRTHRTRRSRSITSPRATTIRGTASSRSLPLPVLEHRPPGRGGPGAGQRSRSGNRHRRDLAAGRRGALSGAPIRAG